jgi:hypothetical protein
VSNFILPALVVVLAVAAAIGSYFVLRQNQRRGHRSIWSYILIWPLLLERTDSNEGGRLFSKRELIGWGVVLVLIAVAVLFNL